MELEALVDADELDAVLALVSLDEVAEAWCRYQSVHHPFGEEEHPDRWAADLLLSREVFRRNELYRTLLLKLVEHADVEVLGVVGAGPLENFGLVDEENLVWLEQQCRVNSRLRQALANVWVWGELPPAICRRIERAAEVPLARPKS